MGERLPGRHANLFVEDYLTQAAPAQREAAAYMVRFLQHLRQIKHFSTSYDREYDYDEDYRHWMLP